MMESGEVEDAAVAVEVQEEEVVAVVEEVPEAAGGRESSTGSLETPGLASRLRTREAEVEKETGATLKMTSR